jgi:membrane protein YdbS with pleckstrin-like domain
MTENVQIKRSPIVLIRTFAAIEAVVLALYLLAAALGNYGELYTKLPFPAILSYQIARLLVLSGAQLLITVYAFLAWYYEIYTVRPDMISHAWGVWFKRKQSVPFRETMSVTLSSGPLGKLLHYGSVHIANANSEDILVLADISYPKRYLEFITRRINAERRTETASPDISSLLKGNEHERLEFKSSLRFDRRAGNVNRELERTAMKSIAGFLNSEGGHLVLGVGDKKEIMGLMDDYQTLQRKDRDGFENHFTQTFNAMIGPEFRHCIRLWFHDADGKDICVVAVESGARPAYVKTDNGEHFYVRTGNITTSLQLSEVEAYARAHWPR